MSDSGTSQRKDFRRWGICIFPTLIALGFLVSPLGRALELLSFDLLFLFRPSPDASAMADVVILNMDEDSREALQQDPNRDWDRTVHARLLRELLARHAKVVAFDVLFDKPTYPQADSELAQAIRDHGSVVLAASVVQSKEINSPSASRVLRPMDALSSNATWGVVEWPDQDAPAILREQLNYVAYTNFAWQAATAFDRAPERRRVRRWMNYYGPEGTVPAISYHRALETNALPSGFFAGKAVFVGASGVITAHGQASDRHATPFSRWRGGQTSGVEIHATAFLNLIRHQWLQETSPWTEIFVLAVFGGLLGITLPRFKPWTGIAVAAAAAILFSAGAISVAWGFYRWFPWLIIVLVQIPCALGWTLVSHTRKLAAEKAMLERDAALSESLARLHELSEGEAASTTHSVTPSGRTQPKRAGDAQLPPIPNHRLIRRIGRGAYGEVWIARDEIGTYHAVKIVYQRGFSSAAPYEREFRGIQRFTPISRSHPGLVHILHVGRNDPEGFFFYIMELGDDEHRGQEVDPATYSPASLAKKIEAGRLPVAECVQLGLDLTAALQHLHEHQLVHRDIKPSNIIYVNHLPKLADVGLVTGITERDKDASWVGTEGYLAPEGPGTPAADIFGLGKVLYEACTGRDRREFPSLSSTLVTSGSRELSLLNEVILKACHPEPRDRYQAASQMHHELANRFRA